MDTSWDIKIANILDDEELLLLKNHSLDTYYYISHFGYENNITKLMLLIDFSLKYPQINNIIEQYVKEVSMLSEINKMCNCHWTALDVCIEEGISHIKIIKVLLENGANVNQTDYDGYSSYYIACSNFNRSIMQLILEYDGINTEIDSDTGYQDTDLSDEQRIETDKIKESIALLNKKN